MSRCPLCPGTYNCVQGDEKCNDYMVDGIGEAPGINEDRKKEVFIGKTGEEVNRHYAPLAGLQRGVSIRFINAIRCLPDTPEHKLDLKKEPHKALLHSCANHTLYNEIEGSRLVVPMGAFACHAIDPDIDLDLHHGIPLTTPHGVAFPMWHPAGGIHEPKKMIHIRNDWYRLGQFLKGRLKVPVDEYAGMEAYSEITDEREIDALLHGREHYAMANDTETTFFHEPFCLTFSLDPGTGFLIRASRQDLLQKFQSHLNRWNGPLLWHNWLFDAQVVAQMGLKYPKKRIVDTMVRVFHLGNLPQGLKALSYRQLGMTMQDFDDLTIPYTIPVVLDYYRTAFLEDWPKPEESLKLDKGDWKLYKPQGMNTKFKRFFTDLAKNPDKDVIKAWENWEDSHDMIEAKLGRWHGKCITHVPFEKALYYACRDADALLRFWPKLQKMRTRVRRESQEHWGETT